MAMTRMVVVPDLIKFAALIIVSISLLYLSRRVSFFTSTSLSSPSHPLQLSNPPKPSPTSPIFVRTGIVDETGAMTCDFDIGELQPDAVIEEIDDRFTRQVNNTVPTISISKFRVCDAELEHYMPCFDDSNGTRHCSEKPLDCVVPRPKNYKFPLPWPECRDKVWSGNVPVASFVQQNRIKLKKDKFVFQGDNGVDSYLNFISEMVPEIGFGQRTRVALDIDCGVASFGAYLMQRNATTLSIAQSTADENHVQIVLERGVPAMVAVFAQRRMLYPSQAFEFIHCSRCRVDWTRDDGILLLEANRILRAGGYFLWVADPVNKDGEMRLTQWKEMEELTSHICWELVNRRGEIAIWRKPLNNSCYLSRDGGQQPPLCDSSDDPDNVRNALKACITLLPENGFGANLTAWPARIHNPPDRLHSIKMDADISRNELFRAESKYWNENIDGYIRAFRWKEFKLRNVLDMRAGFGGFAAALHDLQIDCWVMNVVPTSGFNTLPVIYDRGFIGVMHDWCEPFDTYPRTYDLLHAAGLFSIEQKRCDISNIMLEMDRMLRPGGHVYIRDSVSVINQLKEIASAMGWVASIFDTGEGPHARWKILICEKRL